MQASAEDIKDIIHRDLYDLSGGRMENCLAEEEEDELPSDALVSLE